MLINSNKKKNNHSMFILRIKQLIEKYFAPMLFANSFASSSLTSKDCNLSILFPTTNALDHFLFFYSLHF